MNAPIDPKNVAPVQVTTGSLPGSRKAYFEAAPGVRVPFREIALHESSGEAPLRVYDTSGPYSDETPNIDVNEGLPRLREAWVQTRGVEAYAGREVKPEDNGSVGDAHFAREFPTRHPVYRAYPSPCPSPARGEGTPLQSAAQHTPLSPRGRGLGGEAATLKPELPSSNWPVQASSPRK